MSDGFPTFDDVVDYRRRRLVAELTRLGTMDTDVARAEATRLLVDYINDEEITKAFEWAVREGNG